MKYCKECHNYRLYKPSRKEIHDPSSQWYKWKKGDPTYIYCELLRKLHANDVQPNPEDEACEFFKFKLGYQNNNPVRRNVKY